MMESVEKLSNVSDLLVLYEELKKRDEMCSDKISSLLKEEEYISKKLAYVNENKPDPASMLQVSHELFDLVFSASIMAQEISSKIKQLDLTKNRVNNSSSLVNAILELQNCCKKLPIAMSKKNYEESTELIQQYLSIDSNVFTLATQLLEDGNHGFDVSAVEKHLLGLRNEITENFKYYIKTLDHPNIFTTLKYFKMIGLEKEGLLNFSKYICLLASLEFDDDIIKVEGNCVNSQNLPLEVCVKVLETYASKIKNVEGKIIEQYGKDKLWIVVEHVFFNLQTYFKRAINAFSHHKRLSFLKDYVLNFNINDLKPSNANEGSNINFELQSCANEVSTLLSRINLFNYFIKRRHAYDTGGSRKFEKFWETTDVYLESKRMIEFYVSFETFLVSELISRAVSSEEIDSETKVNKYVEDVMFIVKKIICRCIKNGDILALQKVLSSAIDCLSDKVIQSKLENRILTSSFRDSYSFTSSASKLSYLTQNVTQTPVSRNDNPVNAFLIAMNTLTVFQENLDSFSHELKTEFMPFKSTSTESDWALLNNTLEKIHKELIEKCDKLYKKGVNKVCDGVIKYNLKSLLEPFRIQERVISDDLLEDYTVNDPWVGVFIQKLETVVKPFRNFLIEKNYKHFIEILNKELSQSIEKHILSKDINKNGAIQFDKEIRSIVSFITSISDWHSRDMLCRLTQLAIILNLDTLKEGEYYWSSSSWKIPPNDVRRFLSLRTEFETAEINKLLFTT